MLLRASSVAKRRQFRVMLGQITKDFHMGLKQFWIRHDHHVTKAFRVYFDVPSYLEIHKGDLGHLRPRLNARCMKRRWRADTILKVRSNFGGPTFSLVDVQSSTVTIFDFVLLRRVSFLAFIVHVTLSLQAFHHRVEVV